MKSRLTAYPAFGSLSTADMLVSSNSKKSKEIAFQRNLEAEIESVIIRSLDSYGFSMLKGNDEDSEEFSRRLSSGIVKGVSRGLQKSRDAHPIFNHSIKYKSIKRKFQKLLSFLSRKPKATI
jgi:hypothetical protein